MRVRLWETQNIAKKADNTEAHKGEHDLTKTGESRRKFTRNAFAASVLGTLTSSPVWGGTACSPSGLLSGNLSGHDHEECIGNGCTPGFWMENLDAWNTTPFSPGTCLDATPGGKCKDLDATVATGGATPFGAVFNFDFPLNPGYSLMEVLLNNKNSGGGSTKTYYFHLVAAVLNASSNPGAYGFDPQDIIDLADEVEIGTVSFNDALATLDKMNNAGICFLNAQGEFQE